MTAAGEPVSAPVPVTAQAQQGDAARREIIASIAQLERLLEVLGNQLHPVNEKGSQ